MSSTRRSAVETPSTAAQGFLAQMHRPREEVAPDEFHAHGRVAERRQGGLPRVSNVALEPSQPSALSFVAHCEGVHERLTVSPPTGNSSK